MSTRRISAPEGDLLNVLEDISSLEWRRYQQRSPEVWLNGRFEKIERPEYPPYISFRFEHESQAVIARLKDSLLSYGGKIKWLLVEHKRDSLPGTNWMVCPEKMVEVREEAAQAGISTGQYLAQYEPEFGPAAYDDLVGLTEHIRRAFSEISNKNPSQ
ncbi:hypothetical protein NK553_04090 [Pseudomonas sp. ZM23]|uniref:Uncharacterized protein n=1 Tax=Pseudomonas triclosanedens TaxID=2961893 RepID=A0ABY6ZUQ5_9PSED|nr:MULTISPECIES: hypothetical protein [Pseudomonas]MCP8469819.1 hypothetical protein [Pseudomonas triclosanedens]MCP8473923.1 hypothetical protein [Pseudomonas triclosanedens]MBD9515035.1 hypothetical protein [Pseudomonas sp. PDM22]MCP8463122.1 hypothetical protein [Pseudomonas triclosanedens]WAI48677.1 hypothetical protein OU419_23410 [Pseudomonas triclosanedens]